MNTSEGVSLALKSLLLLVGLPVALRLFVRSDRAHAGARQSPRRKGVPLLAAFLTTGCLAVLSLAAVDGEWGEPITGILRLLTAIGAVLTALIAFYTGYSDPGPGTS